jgi:hypothetical protein
MVAKWAPYETAEGHISIHDPVSGEWHDVPYKDAPRWAKWEARRRAELYRSGHRHAYDLSSAQMHEILEALLGALYLSAGVGSGVLAVISIFKRHERGFLVYLALIPAAFATILVAGQILYLTVFVLTGGQIH